MDILTDSELRPGLFAAAAVTVGNFDGVHLGHQALVRRLVERAEALGGPSVVYTFDPHPLRVLHPAACPPMLSDFADKAARLEVLGIDVMVRARFDREFAERPPHWFAERVLGELLGAAEVWVGPDFAFGRARKGDVKLLEAVGAERGYVVRSHSPVQVGGERVSSTRVREAVGAADFDGAARLLGRPYVVRGAVVHGDGRGRGMGFPTANLSLREECLPPDGVYAAWVHRDGQRLGAAVNVGPNPTFEVGEKRVEAHLLDFDGVLYGEELHLEFVQRIRAEIAFRSAEDLIRQIGTDVERIRVRLDGGAVARKRAAP